MAKATEYGTVQFDIHTAVKKLVLIVLLCSVVVVSAQAASYWFSAFERQTSAAAARRYLFSVTNNPSPGDTIRWDGTNFHWGP